MALAGMLNTDEEALICDMAETYHVFDYKALPVRMAALLASGLRDNSRIKMKISGQKASNETILTAMAVDRLGQLVWLSTEDGHKGINRPPLITPQLIREDEKDTLTFDSIEEFEEKRKEILKKGGSTWQQN